MPRAMLWKSTSHWCIQQHSSLEASHITTFCPLGEVSQWNIVPWWNNDIFTRPRWMNKSICLGMVITTKQLNKWIKKKLKSRTWVASEKITLFKSIVVVWVSPENIFCLSLYCYAALWKMVHTLIQLLIPLSPVLALFFQALCPSTESKPCFVSL